MDLTELLAFGALGVPILCTPLLVGTVWWVWIRRDRLIEPRWRATALLTGVLAASTNALMYYLWLAYRGIAGDSPAVWSMKDFLGNNIAGYLIIAALIGVIVGKGRARLPLALSTIVGALLWIRVGIL